jgi:hypothetical protein
MHRGDGKAAEALAKKLLTWCPADNLGVRILLGGISLMTGTKINEHLYWHASNRNGPDWATDYLSAPGALCTGQFLLRQRVDR